ncbi:MAG TPA: hypothetical protein VLK85_36110 [Ramlibacter sp.]|nr:hypothetical protein [Ramlibacter sp.]
MQATLTVLIDPVAGREGDFNDWLTNVHIRDVMRFAGAIRVQRLVASPHQVTQPSHRYFTIYDTFDPALLSREHREAMGTRRMVVTNAHDRSNVINGYYYPVAARTNQPTALTPNEQPLVLEQMDVPEHARGEFEDWYATVRLPALLRCPSHVSGTLMRSDPWGQMFVFPPAYSHIALWRIDDLPTALDTWRRSVSGTPLEAVKRRVTCFEPLEPYLTRDQVAHATVKELEIEEMARRRAEESAATTEQLGVKWR